MRLDLDIINEKGLHARASAKFVETVESFDAQATVAKDGMEVGGDSIMGLMMLAASKGSQIAVETSGNQSQELAEALRELVGDFFGEGK
ncbi:HPr family phosphocarrier protein [Neptunicoccus cionae]|uniref:HPr kinase n=1 Tax=Neptunicoccus cionae TaxID=2035344 RepID=A0A916QTB4_9RHOB|nr:HPr family phosphocarrier protein [Amylibacter cionae]GGA05969.1 HPr kinase [Amylibacter cionae]